MTRIQSQVSRGRTLRIEMFSAFRSCLSLFIGYFHNESYVIFESQLAEIILEALYDVEYGIYVLESYEFISLFLFFNFHYILPNKNH